MSCLFSTEMAYSIEDIGPRSSSCASRSPPIESKYAASSSKCHLFTYIENCTRAKVIANLAIHTLIYEGKFHDERVNWACPFNDCKDNFKDAKSLVLHVSECQRVSITNLYCNSCASYECFAFDNQYFKCRCTCEHVECNERGSSTKGKMRRFTNRLFNMNRASSRASSSISTMHDGKSPSYFHQSETMTVTHVSPSPSEIPEHHPAPPAEAPVDGSQICELSGEGWSELSGVDFYALGTGCSISKTHNNLSWSPMFDDRNPTASPSQMEGPHVGRVANGDTLPANKPIITCSKAITEQAPVPLSESDIYGAGQDFANSDVSPSSSMAIDRSFVSNNSFSLPEGMVGACLSMKAQTGSGHSWPTVSSAPTLVHSSPESTVYVTDLASDASLVCSEPMPPYPLASTPTDGGLDSLSCPLCGFRPQGNKAKLLTYLKKHMRSHGPIQSTCEECGRGFTRLDNLKKHQRTSCPSRGLTFSGSEVQTPGQIPKVGTVPNSLSRSKIRVSKRPRPNVRAARTMQVGQDVVQEQWNEIMWPLG